MSIELHPRNADGRTKLISREERGHVITKEGISYEYGPVTTIFINRWTNPSDFNLFSPWEAHFAYCNATVGDPELIRRLQRARESIQL